MTGAVSGPPAVQIVHGAPTTQEAAAVEAAIVKLWREDLATAAPAPGSSESPWLLAARADGVRPFTRLR